MVTCGPRRPGFDSCPVQILVLHKFHCKNYLLNDTKQFIDERLLKIIEEFDGEIEKVIFVRNQMRPISCYENTVELL